MSPTVPYLEKGGGGGRDIVGERTCKIDADKDICLFFETIVWRVPKLAGLSVDFSLSLSLSLSCHTHTRRHMISKRDEALREIVRRRALHLPSSLILLYGQLSESGY